MKKILLACPVFVLLAGIASAHPPSDIVLASDVKTGEIKIFMPHKVKDAAQHFIYAIEVKVNGKKALRQDASTQTSADSQDLVYVFPGLKEGDKIEVYAECNKTGDMKRVFTAGAEKAPKKGK